MTKKEEHKESTKEVKKPTEEIEEEEVEEEFPESDAEFESDEDVEGNKEMMILDETANKLIHKIETLDPDDKNN
ncbi:hypothetical protein J6W20_00485 [bacterium]|nr:hypothetical protein [bacterium]